MDRKKITPNISLAISDLGKNISTARKNHQISQKNLARKTDIPIAEIQCIESGDPEISIGTLVRILIALDSIHDFNRIMDISGNDSSLLTGRSSSPKGFETIPDITALTGNPPDKETEGLSL